MEIEFRCDKCGQSVSVCHDAIPSFVRCPACGRKIAVPQSICSLPFGVLSMIPVTVKRSGRVGSGGRRSVARAGGVVLPPWIFGAAFHAAFVVSLVLFVTFASGGWGLSGTDRLSSAWVLPAAQQAGYSQDGTATVCLFDPAELAAMNVSFADENAVSFGSNSAGEFQLAKLIGGNFPPDADKALKEIAKRKDGRYKYWRPEE